jgi:hypothetical protein
MLRSYPEILDLTEGSIHLLPFLSSEQFIKIVTVNRRPNFQDNQLSGKLKVESIYILDDAIKTLPSSTHCAKSPSFYVLHQELSAQIFVGTDVEPSIAANELFEDITELC